jgi:hypothetical protein
MVGDAGCFLDPIFSPGVTLARKSPPLAAKQTAALLRGQTMPGRARHEYTEFVSGSTAVFWRLIRNYYQHSFRELFLNGTGPANVHGAVISVLAGHVFPKPPFALRWRLWLFYACLELNKVLPLVPRRKPFSLLTATPNELPQIVGGSGAGEAAGAQVAAA